MIDTDSSEKFDAPIFRVEVVRVGMKPGLPKEKGEEEELYFFFVCVGWD